MEEIDQTEDPNMVHFFFFLATIFLLIVLLNLLISIISDTYQTIEDNQVSSMYQEMASLIDDNDFLVSSLEVFDKYILMAKPDQQIIEEIEDEKLDTKDHQILEAIGELKEHMVVMDDKIGHIKQEQANMQAQISYQQMEMAGEHHHD
jgi:hypothetical protein